MSGTHEGKVAIVTGAGRGLGRAMALGLLHAGASVTLVDVDAQVLDEATAAAADEGSGDRALTIAADVGLDESAPFIVRDTRQRFGHLDILVNNAGVGIQQLRPEGAPALAKYWEVTPTEFRRIYEVNTVGFFLMTLAALPDMRSRGWGRVINITTSLRTMFLLYPYGGTKAADEANTAMLATDLEGSGVTANVLIPGGAVNTRLAVDMFSESARANLLKSSVMVDPLLWLTSAEADGVNGQRFVANTWDSSLAGAQNAERCGAPAAWPGVGPPAKYPD